MTRDEQFQTLLRLYTASMEHNIVLKGKLAISQPIGTEPYATLKRIYKTLFAGEFKDKDGFLITPAADRNLLRAIGTVRAPEAELPSAQKNQLLAILGRVHDQLQDVRNILKGKSHE